MIEFLYGIDRAVFLFINQTLSNPVGDALWPSITDYDKQLPVRIVLVAVWLWLIIKGGVKGRTAAFLLIPILVASDQLSSHVIKGLVMRVRPIYSTDPMLAGHIHQLVGAGSWSFPSSHAVNNFAVATLFQYYYGKWRAAFYGWACLIAISRPAVGVHFPSDIAGGAIIGTVIAFAVIMIWTFLQRRYIPRWSPEGIPAP